MTEYGDAREYEQVEEVKQEISLTPHLVTISASPASDLFPYSLGMRTDYIRMKPFDGLQDDDERRINPVETTIQHAYAQAEKEYRNSQTLETRRTIETVRVFLDFGLRLCISRTTTSTFAVRGKG